VNNGVVVRIIAMVVGAAVGAFFGIAGTIAHTVVLTVDELDFPVGLVVALLTCVALMVAIRALTNDVFIVLATGIGMLVALFLLSGGGPGGSILVPDEVTSHIWIWSIVVAVAVITLLPFKAAVIKQVDREPALEPDLVMPTPPKLEL
jgi:hypothetical protein